MGQRSETQAGSWLVSALADLRLGTLIGAREEGPAGDRLESFAAAAPELFATDRVSWEIVFQRLKRKGEIDGLHDLVLVSRGHVHIALRSARDPAIVLIATAPRTRSIGLIVSEARARLTQLEGVQ